MKEIVSEKRHIENLFYVRELLKYDLDEWVLERKSGHITYGPEDAMDIINNISIVDDALTAIYTELKELEILKR